MGLIDKVTGKGLAVKTARDLIDGSFRALSGCSEGGARHWGPIRRPRLARQSILEPDRSPEDERDVLVDYFRRKDPGATRSSRAFHTGLRPGEAMRLRHGALDLRAGRLYGPGNSHARRGQSAEDPEQPAHDHAYARRSSRSCGPCPSPCTSPPTLRVYHADRATGGRRALRRQHWHRTLRATGNTAAEVLCDPPRVHLGGLQPRVQHRSGSPSTAGRGSRCSNWHYGRLAPR